MVVTVRDIVGMSQLACSVQAGERGLDRPVLWAHSCELPDPWTWLGRDELLMTVGMCVPEGAAAQVAFIEGLAAKGLAAIAIGDHSICPTLAPDMLSRADELCFPVLMVRYTTPFATMSRTVAIASHSEQIARITRLSRLYERAMMATPGSSELLEELSVELGLSLHVIDVEYGTEVLAQKKSLPSGLVKALQDEVAGTERLPPRMTVDVDGASATAFALATHRCCVLAFESGDVYLDAFVILHSQNVVGVEVERVTRERERTDKLGAALMQQLVDGEMGGNEAAPRLEQAGLSGPRWFVLAFPESELEAARAILSDKHVAYLSNCAGGVALMLCNREDSTYATETLKERVISLGISSSLAEVKDISEGAREARWALETVRSRGGTVAHYGESAPLFLPRTVDDARSAVRLILGPLIDSDRNQNTDLVRTLQAYLSSSRSWKETADKLYIHRQTLGYRLRRIESLTGRSTRQSGDIAMFWMAIKAAEIIDRV